MPLQLLQSLAEACRDFAGRLRAEINTLDAQTAGFRKRPAAREGTVVHGLLLNLSATTDIETVGALAKLSSGEQERLEQLKGDLAVDPVKAARKVKAQKERIEELIATVSKSDALLTPITAEELRDLLLVAKDKATAVQLSASEVFKKEPLPQAGSEVWKTLWEATRAFSAEEAYPSQAFPNAESGAVCVLCQQELSAEASTRLRAFEKFVQQKVQQAAEDAKRAVRNRKDEIKRACVSDEFMREIVRLLRDDLDRPQMCSEVIRNLTRSRVRGKRLTAASEATVIGPQRLVTSVVSKLEEIANELAKSIEELEKTSDPKQRVLKQKELWELEDRVWLASILDDIEVEMKRLKKIAALVKASGDTDTNRITRKTTEVSRALVTNTLRDAFSAEIAALNIADRRVELLQEGSGYGITRFKVSLIRNPGRGSLRF